MDQSAQGYHTGPPPDAPPSDRLRTPPHSDEAEVSLLGGVMLGGIQTYLSAGPLEMGAFYHPKHRIIWEVIKQLCDGGTNPDAPTVSAELQRRLKLDEIGGNAYLAELVDRTVGTANAPQYAAIVRDRDAKRRVIKGAMDLAESAFDGGTADELTAHVAAIRDLLIRQSNPARRISTVTPEAVNWIWRDWLPRGVPVMLAAEGGTGKGLTWAAWAAMVTNPKDVRWPDGHRHDEPEAVLIHSVDDDPALSLWPRLTLAGADLARCYYTESVESLRAEASRMTADGIRIGLVVMDVPEGGIAGNSNSANDVFEHLDHLPALARETGAAVVIVHHVSKFSYAKLKEGASPRDLVRGSGAWVDKIRWLLMMVRDRSCPNHSRLLIRGKGNMGGIDWSDGAWRVFGETRNLHPDDEGRMIRDACVTEWRREDGDAFTMFLEASKPPKTEDGGRETPVGDAFEEWFFSAYAPGQGANTGTLQEAASKHGWSWRPCNNRLAALRDEGRVHYERHGKYAYWTVPE